MNLVMAIRAESLQTVITAVLISVVDRQMMRILITALFATELPFALNRSHIAADPVIKAALFICMAHGALTRTKGNMPGLNRLSAKFARARWLGVVFVRAAFMRFRGASPGAELRRGIPRPGDSRKGLFALLALILSFASLFVIDKTLSRAEGAGQVRTRLCKLFPAAAANKDSTPGSSRVVPAFWRTKLRLLRSFIASSKWLRAVLAGIDGVEIMALFTLPGMPAFARTEARYHAMRSLSERGSALLTFVNLPAAFLAQSETVLGTKPGFSDVMVCRHKRFLAPLALTQWILLGGE